MTSITNVINIAKNLSHPAILNCITENTQETDYEYVIKFENISKKYTQGTNFTDVMYVIKHLMSLTLKSQKPYYQCDVIVNNSMI